MQAHSHTHAYGGAAQLEVGYLTVSVSWLSALENAADTVFTPHSCLTTPCPTHCSPAYANVCPIRMHRLILGLSTLNNFSL